MDKKKEGAKKEPIVITRDKGGQKISYQVLEDLSSPADVYEEKLLFHQVEIHFILVIVLLLCLLKVLLGNSKNGLQAGMIQYTYFTKVKKKTFYR